MSPAHEVQPQGKGLGGQWTWGASQNPLGKDSKASPGQSQGATISPPSPPSATTCLSLVPHWHCRGLRGPTQPKRTSDVRIDSQLRMKSHGLF